MHHKYLASHLRSPQKVILNPYPLIKNRCYFALQNGRRTRSEQEVRRILAAQRIRTGTLGAVQATEPLVANTGNVLDRIALLQAKQFTQTVPVTGLIVTKLDSTSKGGIVFAIRDELDLPIKFVGTLAN